MCVTTLQIAGTVLGMAAQKQQADAAASAYNAQAQQADQNAKLANRQQESIADAYADKQSELRQRAAIARGQQAASAGARGLEGGSGSVLDVLAGSYDAYNQDTRNLLTNQRNDIWNKKVEEINYMNNASAARAASNNADSAGRWGMMTTLVSGAANTAAYLDKYKPAKKNALSLKE